MLGCAELAGENEKLKGGGATRRRPVLLIASNAASGDAVGQGDRLRLPMDCLLGLRGCSADMKDSFLRTSGVGGLPVVQVLSIGQEQHEDGLPQVDSMSLPRPPPARPTSDACGSKGDEVTSF